MTDEENGFGSNGFQMMGIMSALKTGDVHTDMFIAMCVPFVLKILFGWVGKLEDIQNWKIWKRGSGEKHIEMHHRYISHTTTVNPWGEISSLDEDTQNSVLLKAIKLYLHSVIRLKLNSAHLDLTGLDDHRSSYDYDDDDDDDGEYGSRRTLVGIMSRYKIVDRLLSNEWHDLGQFGDPASSVSVRIENESHEQEEGTNEKKTTSEVTRVTFHFMSPGDGAINAFIDKSYAWYLGELRKLEDHSRYFYEAKIPEFTAIGGGNGGSSTTTFKRYKLSNEKTFDSLFFREKESLLSLIDHFNAKTGKYSIKGYPHKLGVLLHGHPGTGKTSLIKALAHYTGRSIVNVPLSSVSTNAQLMSIFFDRKYRVEGTWVPVKLGFKDVIFVMEDVDAASRIVKRRDGKKPSSEVVVAAEPGETTIDLPMPKSLWRMFVESTTSDCKELVNILMDMSERLKCEADAMRPEVMHSLARRLARMPALGLLGDAISGGDVDPALVQVCEQAMASANQQKERQSKLDNILSSYAKEIKELLDAATEVDDRFVSELLGETDSLPTTLPSTLTLLSKDATADLSASTSSLESVDWMGPLERPTPPSGSETEAVKLPATKPGKGGAHFGPSSMFLGNPDQLSLSGLLNVLDGVVDTPGRIIIMTTNHPEMLDPALIRPGRVDKKLMLGYMGAPDVASMLEHYFQMKFNESQLQEIVRIIEDDGNPKNRLNLTPAQVEQLAAEHDTVEDMLTALKKMAVMVRPRKLIKCVNSQPTNVL